jgi:ribosomal protein S18 acetylase RimI-like enzyme
MEYLTVDYWDKELWNKVSSIYLEAFAEKGGKPEKIIQNMFRKNICFLHVGIENGEAAVMAITGNLDQVNALLIDYLAVHKGARGRGEGLKMMEYIKEWSIKKKTFSSHLIEVESDETPENLARITFWEKCGFTLTEYIHHYIWVPEPYRAMYHKLAPSSPLPEDGKQLFKYISQFHKQSFTGVTGA